MAMQASDLNSMQPGSPPYIVDYGMEDSRHDHDLDLDLFGQGMPHDDALSPGAFLANDFIDQTAFGSPIVPNKKLTPTTGQATASPENAQRSEPSQRSSTSPVASFPDSSSDSSDYNRKSSSDSSRSANAGKDATMTTSDMDMVDWKGDDVMGGMGGMDGPNYGQYDGTINPSFMTHSADFNDKAMENDFDFDSASSSPNPFGLGGMSVADADSPEAPVIKQEPRRKTALASKANTARHIKAYSQSMTQSMNGLTTNASRDASPLSSMITSQESSPSAFFNSPSPPSGPGFQNGETSDASQGALWKNGYRHNGLPQNAQVQAAPMPQFQNIPPVPPQVREQTFFAIHPTPLKSRVETQIPIKMTLWPFPRGVTKLRLPTHTISKPKLLAKPPPQRSPDTLELHVMLVCTSAMQNPEYRVRAMQRAAAGFPPPPRDIPRKSADGSEDDNDENRPLNGGEVQICGGCITRERKRAARKKVKKVEEEEAWHKDEHRRVIVFNTHEIKEWQPPSPQPSSEATGDRRIPVVPDGALQVDAPMRIACYCRHQNEKLGFQVIFTLKDYQDRLVAQQLTSSIMITDDHKTHAIPGLTPSGSMESDVPPYPNPNAHSYELPSGLNFRHSHSTSDIQSLQHNYAMQQNQQQQPQQQFAQNPNQSSQMSQASNAATPRSLSRQASPSGSLGPSSKKRKASGSNKVPSGLAMTRLETNHQSFPGPPTTTGTASATTSAAPSPFTPSMGSFPRADPQSQQSSQFPPQFRAGPPTPNNNDQAFFSNANRSQSMESLAHPMYSAPTSAHPSRPPSPGRNMQNLQQQQAQMQAFGMFAVSTLVDARRPPTIHKLIPNEGSTSGGIEVTCLGSGFVQGLEVMFGDQKATTSTYWGETSIVCLLPPSAVPGPVPVTFKQLQQPHAMHPFPAIPKQHVLFNYVDDNEQQMIKMALSVLSHKMTGKIEDVRELARRIVGDGGAWGLPNGQGSAAGGQTRSHQDPHLSALNLSGLGTDTETMLLRCFELIDLDDSPRPARWNMRRSSGQTMLHLACSLGFHRVVAGLLARGANPEPRDKGGYTPMHFAALHDHSAIVRRLMLSGADPSMRSLQGLTPADMASTDEVYKITRKVLHHSRSRSGTSMRSRTSSATSIRSLWEPPSEVSSTPNMLLSGTAAIDDDDDDDGQTTDEDADPVSPPHDDAFWMNSRRNSTKPLADTDNMEENPLKRMPSIEAEAPPQSPIAAMAAFRDQLSAQIHQLQQRAMHLNLPNLPQIPAIANLPDYQAYLPASPMVRRISSLVPHMGGGRPASPDHGAVPKETDYKWWDLFNVSGSTAPPAYEDIYPDKSLDVKKRSAATAAVDALADNKCATIFEEQQTDQQQSSSSSSQPRPKTVLGEVRIGTKHPISHEQQEQLRLAYAEKVKRISRDRNLFLFWIPLLLLIMMAMLYNRVPQIWAIGKEIVHRLSVQNNAGNTNARVMGVY